MVMSSAVLFLCAGSATALSRGDQLRANWAPGVNLPPLQRTPPQRWIWSYTGAVTQGDAENIYNSVGQPTVEDVLNTPMNQLSFIANVNVNQSTNWWAPGANNTHGCGQLQTFELPFGYNALNKSTEEASLPIFHSNLKKLHDSGITITLTLGSWCTQLPINSKQEWSDADFSNFVTYFQEVRSNVFGGYLDGIDFDWEGYCDAGCLKGTCICAWDDQICGQATPDELAAGIFWEASPLAGQPKMKHQCWIMPTSSTFQVMTGITHAMKQAGFVVTLVPMSTSMYSGDDDSTPKQVMRNEYVKYRKQTSLGQQVDLLDLADGILLQWYSGFDAALCENTYSPTSKSCTCDNIPADDYPNVLDTTRDADGLLVASWQTYWNVSGNYFPSTFPVRCQACGKNVIMPDGSRKDLPCADDDEQWYVPSVNRTSDGANPLEVVADHNAKLEAYVQKKQDIPKWWIKDQTVNSKCPRGIDCPDFRYQGEQPYSRQLFLLKSLTKVVDLAKIAIGFETLGVDVQVQMQSWQDHALPWTTSPLKAHEPPTPYDNYTYYKPCTENMTLANYKDQKRCAMPLLSQQWGPKFDADEILGLEAAVKQQLGKQLAGVGFFTLDGVLSQKKGSTRRFWQPELQKLNQTYALPCLGDCCGCAGDDPFLPTPAPPVVHGSYTVKAGDSCYNIADSLCQDGNNWAKDICNGASFCTALQPGQVLQYDCSGSGKFCNGPTAAPEIVV